MSNKEKLDHEKLKAPIKRSDERRYAAEGVRSTNKLSESQTRPLSSGGKKQRQKSKLAPRG